MDQRSSLPETVDAIEASTDLDQAVDAVARFAEARIPEGPLRDALQGEWLGHPLHPMLTDVVIGFWTSAFVLDLVPVKRLRAASDVFVALGLASVAPTVASGLADYLSLDRKDRRVAVVHLGANVVASGLYGWSLFDRVRGKRVRGIALAMAGAGAATVGGYLGGHLAFPKGAPGPG